MKLNRHLTYKEHSNKVLTLIIGLVVVIVLFAVVASKTLSANLPWIEGKISSVFGSEVYSTKQHNWRLSNVRWSGSDNRFLLEMRLDSVGRRYWYSSVTVELSDFRSLCDTILTSLPTYEQGTVHRSDIQKLVIALPAHLTGKWGRAIAMPVTEGACISPLQPNGTETGQAATTTRLTNPSASDFKTPGSP